MLESETIGDFLRRMRDESNIPLRKMAALLDIDPSTLSKMERGLRFPSQETIVHIASQFSIEEQEMHAHYLSERIALELIEVENTDRIVNLIGEKIKIFQSRAPIVHGKR